MELVNVAISGTWLTSVQIENSHDATNAGDRDAVTEEVFRLRFIPRHK